MNKLLKYSLYGVFGLIGLVLIAVAIFALTFNPNDYKPMMIDLVKEKKQRTLTIEGDIGLAFWPKLGANLGKVSISEYQSSEVFASVNNVKVALAVMPLLKKELVVDTIYVDGAKANVVKRKDGTFNFDDLLSKDEEESEQIKFDVDGVHVTNSEVSYTDETSGAMYNVSQFNLESGRIALAVPVDLATDFVVKANQPKVDAKAKIKGNFFFDPETKHVTAKKLDTLVTGSLLDASNVKLTLNGDVDAKLDSMELDVKGLALVASADMQGANHQLDLTAPALEILKDQISSQKVSLKLAKSQTDNTLKLNMTLADMKGSPKAIQSSGITGDLAIVQGKRTVNSQFSSPFNGNLEQLIFDIPKLAGNVDIKDPALPNGGVKGTFAIGAHAAVKDEQANAHFNLVLADTKLNGDVDVASFKTPHIKFNLNADKLDLNKLLGKPATSAPKPAEKSSDTPADLSALKALHLDGKVNIGSMLYQQYQVSGLNVAIKADGEKLALSGLNVKVDDSQIKGNFAISQFSKPLYTFDIDIDQVNLDKYMPAEPAAPAKSKPQTDKPLDLSPLKALNAQGSIRVGSLKYGKTNASNINIKLSADGQKLDLNPLSVKVDNSQINGRFGITQFSNPAFGFNVHIDKLDADQYIASNDAPAPTNKSNPDTPIDLSALKKLNASGEATIDWLKLANVKTERVNIGLKAANGVATVSPFSANLYQGSMSGSLNVDARTTPNISFKQTMKGIAIGPLLVDAINNDMLAGKGTLNVDVTTQGNTVSALKKALAGNAALNLADGAVKGIDIAGSIRDLKSKVNVFQSKDAVDGDKRKKTDFSELSATFSIKNGVAHNNDLEMKAPILRLAKGDSKGNIDIANQTIDYSAKPTIVKTLKGQGGADVDQLAGIGIPIKITGSFANPKFGMDMSAVASGFAQSKLLDKVGGEKGAAVKELVGGDNKVDAIKGLLNKKKPAETTDADSSPAPAEAPKSLKEETKEKALKKLLNF
jgi:uncharacterized protein involved in outer membrane biogenesis